ncbi:hypothetical protein BJ085DRAFT_35870, partial [Dimargaris cristalligena]
MSQHNLLADVHTPGTAGSPPPSVFRQFRALLSIHVTTLRRSPMALFIGVIFPVFTVFIGILAGKLVDLPELKAGDVANFPLAGSTLPTNALLPYVLQDPASFDFPWSRLQTQLQGLINMPTPRAVNFSRFESLDAIQEYQRQEVIHKNRDRSYTPRQPTVGLYLRSLREETSANSDTNTNTNTNTTTAFNYAVLYSSPQSPNLPGMVHMMEQAQWQSLATPGSLLPIVAKVATFPTQASEVID